MPGVHIGTSGWHYQHWRDNFYPHDLPVAGMLRYYAQRFGTVEINNSFYRLPTMAAVKNWVEQTPKNFLFAVKASRYITHMKKLLDPETTTFKFLKMAEGFGKKLGPILFQFPSAWQVNEERLKSFLSELPRNRRYAFEFRHPSWHNARVYKMLERFKAALCIFDIGGFQSPIEVTADLVYVRLHGPGKAYQGKYTSNVLQEWAARIDEWTNQSRDVFIYFDNDQAGFATQNALELQNLIFRQPSATVGTLNFES
jgi:uncharacterized protein YecE (DUF72 family)